MGGQKSDFYADIMTLHPEVTGSCHYVNVRYPDGRREKFLIDCGLFQEERYWKYNNSFPFKPYDLDFVIITHNHTDHHGRLPFLFNQGFKNSVYMTNITADLIKPAQEDNFKIIQSIYKKKKERPLYKKNDLEEVLHNTISCEYFKEYRITENISINFYENGHLLGATVVLVKIGFKDRDKINLIFTGDYNHQNKFFCVEDIPEEVKELQTTIICESTYGTTDSYIIDKVFRDNLEKAIKEYKKVIIPAFSLSRVQEVLFELKCMQEEGQLSVDIPILLDGNLSIKYTEKFLKNKDVFKPHMQNFLPENLTYVNKSNRQNLFEKDWVSITVTSSGTGSYGPAPEYISKVLSRRDALIHFTGYSIEGSLSRKLMNAKYRELVNISGENIAKNCDVEYTSEFSSHAKMDELIFFLKKFRNIKAVLINHGQFEVKEVFEKVVKDELNPKSTFVESRDVYCRVNSYGIIKRLTSKFD